MDEIRLNQEVSRASRARALLEDELLVSTLADLEAAYIDRWRHTHIDDDRGREKLFIAVNVVGKVREHLSAIVSNGSMAAKQLDDLAKQAERKKLLGIL